MSEENTIQTDTGHALKPAIMQIAEWGLKHIEGTRGPTAKELKAMKKRHGD